MASTVSEDENSDDYLSDNSQCSVPSLETSSNLSEQTILKDVPVATKTTNIVHNLYKRQIYGRFTKHPKAKTENAFNSVHNKCIFPLSSLINDTVLNHIYMGFTLCGRYFLSYSVGLTEDLSPLGYNVYSEYELHVWNFVPGQRLKLSSKHKIFKHHKGSDVMDKVYFLQFPGDPHKIVCYGISASASDTVHITILTLPTTNCKHCKGPLLDTDGQGWCLKHGFIIHYMFSMTAPSPKFDPHISLAYPDNLVINTGLNIHILNVTTMEPILQPTNFVKDDVIKLISNTNFNDTMSEVSETASEHFGSSSIVDAILEDFSEYDLESSECNKPFHELNISCEPLNVTGKSYHNALVQNIVDPRLKRLQNSKEYLFSIPQSSSNQKPAEKSKIDKKIAEKAYEFIEENEKCEKLSSFRKKRLAEKKYEFNEDNNENIVPFNSLRRERRYLHRSQTRCIRSPDFNSIFRSPNSRTGQFSPVGARNLYCPSIRNSPHHSKSPISPRESARKFYVYSPSLDSDCSDSDSRLILRTPSNLTHSQLADKNFQNGLLIVDPKNEVPKWIKKVVRRYSNGDFENSSLVSGQSRDDNNLSIEIPLLVQNLTDQQLDVVPDFRVDPLTEMQLIVTQRSLDCEQFVYRRAQKLCIDSNLEFLHCEDYDIKILHVCPIDGYVVCQAAIKVGALINAEPYSRPKYFSTHCLFTWNIASDSFDVIEDEGGKLLAGENFKESPRIDIPRPLIRDVLVMNFCYKATKTKLRDYNNYYEVCLGSENMNAITQRVYVIQEYSSDSD